MQDTLQKLFVEVKAAMDDGHWCREGERDDANVKSPPPRNLNKNKGVDLSRVLVINRLCLNSISLIIITFVFLYISKSFYFLKFFLLMF